MSVTGTIFANAFSGDGSGLSNVSGVWTGTSGDSVYVNSTNVGIGTSSPTGMFKVGNDSLVVLNNGNIGIGTTSPSDSLTVNGSISADSMAISGTITVAAISGTFDNSADSYIRIGNLQIALGRSSISFSASFSEQEVITFPVPFKTGIIHSIVGSSGTCNYCFHALSPGNSSFTANIRNSTDASNTITIGYSWTAIGLWQ